MAEFPMLPLWTDAYLADTVHLSTIEHGAYLLLLMAMWRTKAKRLPNDDKLLARFARLTPGQWQRIKPTVMPFFVDHGVEISQSRLTDEANAVRRNSTRQSDKAKTRWLNNKETPDAAAKPEACRNDASLPISTPISNISPNGDSPPLFADGLLKKAPRERYPAANKLAMNGKQKSYPDEFEVLWQTYPRRSEDTKDGCYKHWRSWVVERRVDPETIIDGAKDYAKAKACDDHRFGLLRWCREGLWLETALTPQRQAPNGHRQPVLSGTIGYGPV